MLTIGSHSFAPSSVDKVLFPDDGLTKGDLIAYYRDVSDTLLQHARGRPLTLERHPDGLRGSGFFQQRRPAHFPPWIPSLTVQRAGKSYEQVEHVTCEDEATLAYLADQGVVTLHGWLSREDHLEQPDRIVFDLDPPGDDFRAVVSAARRVRDILDEIDLPAFVMTTGSRGLHVVVPIAPGPTFDEARAFARDVAAQLAERHPSEFTVEHRKSKRGGKLYLDVTRNAWGQTVVLPYSVRAKPEAPVATPLDWDELGRASLGPRSYGVRNVRRRLGQKPDPWADLPHRARLTTARAALRDLSR